MGKGTYPKLELKGNESLLDIGCGDGKITTCYQRICRMDK